LYREPSIIDLPGRLFSSQPISRAAGLITHRDVAILRRSLYKYHHSFLLFLPRLVVRRKREREGDRVRERERERGGAPARKKRKKESGR